MKNVLVIGGGGFIGSHTVVALSQAGINPIVLDNFGNSEKSVLQRLEQLLDQKIVFYDADFQDQRILERIIQKENIDGVIHFAAYKAVGESVEQPLKYYSNNVGSFINLLDFLQSKSINNIVLSSSAAVYGNPPTDRVDETAVCKPTSPYGWSKLMDEVILRDTCSANTKLKGIALRYFNVVGAHESAQIGELPRGKPQNLLPVIIQAIEGKIPPLTVYGTDYPTPDGTCLRDYIHVVDLAEAHVSAIKKLLGQKTGIYKVYNVGTGKPTSVLELIKTFERVNKVKVPYKLGPRRVGDPVSCFAAVDKAKKELGWKAKKTLDDSVRDAWHWQQIL